MKQFFKTIKMEHVLCICAKRCQDILKLNSKKTYLIEKNLFSLQFQME